MANEKDTLQEEVIEEVLESEEDLSNELHNDVDQLEIDESTDALKKVSELEAAIEEKENKILRLQADFDNYRRRVRLDQEAASKYRAQNLVSDILPALDNFERALKVDTEDEKMKSLLQGMEMVYRQLVEAVKNEGVEVIEAVGQVFDPHLHQAVMQVEDSNFEPNTVVEEFQKGYKLYDRVIRPSMVKVNQ
ncbi:nucleotide exchange factor GrpE [Bacillus salitolerans]|uniref:Protein GrpE n=1 Tax=Bacillus salitolerans TaxID=1437434 RepID=A0ABW4LP25_9BACI